MGAIHGSWLLAALHLKARIRENQISGVRFQDVAAGLCARVYKHGKRVNLLPLTSDEKRDAENLPVRFDEVKEPDLHHAIASFLKSGH